MTTLTEFLLARIAEEEATAKAASTGPWKTIDRYVSLGLPRRTGTPTIDALGRADAAHIARHDPARVLDECEAKRRIIERVENLTDGEKTYAERCEMSDAEFNRWRGVRDILAPLALPYAEHPDYRDEWKPLAS